MHPDGEQRDGGRRGMLLFFLGAALIAMAGAVFDTTFNNYLRFTFKIEAGARGVLEFPREFPGLAVTVLAGALLFLPEVRVAAVAAGCVAVGALGLAVGTTTYAQMVGWMVLFSTGVHLIMPVQGAVAIGFAEEGRRGKRLGQLGMATTSAAVAGCLVVWVVLYGNKTNFRATFQVAAGLGVVAMALFLVMPPHRPHNPRRRKLVFRRKYWLFYVLCGLFGARKQIFLTFGPWVIITIFGQPATTIALLVFVGRLIGVAVKPLLGRLIDAVGPRVILVADAVLLIGVCLDYAFARRISSPTLALAAIYSAFVLDDVLFAVGMARTVYVVRLTTDHEEVVGTLAAGVSINHLVSMTVPALGGVLWISTGGPEAVFLAAAGVMVITLVFALFARTPPARPEE